MYIGIQEARTAAEIPHARGKTKTWSEKEAAGWGTRRIWGKKCVHMIISR